MWINRLLLVAIFVIVAVMGGLASYLSHPPDDSPPAPYVEKERTFHYPMQFIQALHHNPNPGKAIFHAYCQSCHVADPVIPVHAPAIGDRNAWQPFAKMPMKTLLKFAASGYGAMPARGGCFECDDHYLRLAILYLLKQSS